MTLKNKIYQEGYGAYYAAVDVDDNPYDFYQQEPMWALWYEGWDDAYNEDESK